MSRFPLDQLVAVLEAPARPFARCLAHYWHRQMNTTRLLSSVVFLTLTGPINLVLWLAGFAVGANSEGQYWLVFAPLLLATGAGCEFWITRLAKRMTPADSPSMTDWFQFWAAPISGPILFVFGSV
jgi:hypothetical protein